MAKWMMYTKKADFDQIAKIYGITPVLARIIRNRDVCGDKEIRKFLEGGLHELYSPFLMKDMDKAAEIILSKIRERRRIRIIGDYDVDGICSAFILWKGITVLGGDVDRVIPHRIKDGYGLNEELIADAAKDGIDTIVTCDNGIAAAAQIAYAKELGMTVVVTDHHEVPFEGEGDGKRYLLPEADAVVDPKQPGCSYPFKQICGGVVAYKLLQAMYEKESEGETTGEDFLADLLPFAALATVCDVMELRDENRILVRHGLKAMAHTKNPGLKALLQVNGIEGKAVTPYHAGFILGPCLNATGRLDTAARALQLFEADNLREAVNIAGDLKSLNDSRKKMTEDGVQEALKQVEESEIGKDRVLVVYLPECHESLAGIIAGRVREKTGKPTFVLTKSEEGVKGSGRSIEAYSMYEEMTKCKEIFTRFGGHRMAAGLSMAEEEDVKFFRKRLNENCTLTEEDFEEIVHIDVPMPLSYVNFSFIRELSLLEPFGVGNPKPLFAQKKVSLLSGRVMGKNKNVGKYLISDEQGNTYDMIYFGDVEKLNSFLSERFGQERMQTLYQHRMPTGELVISMTYYPDINSFGGRESIQIVMQHYC